MILYFILFQIASAVFLRFFDNSGLFYHTVILLHITSGFGIIITLIISSVRIPNTKNPWSRPVTFLLGTTVFLGVLLALFGRSGTAGEIIFNTHVISAIGLLVTLIIMEKIQPVPLMKFCGGAVGVFSFLAATNLLIEYANKKQPIGELTDLFPSPAQTATQTYIQPASLNQSSRCGASGCHPDIHSQWRQSAHRFSSFNNPFYTGSVDYLLSTGDSTVVRWCAGCHDPVMLHSGLMTGKPDQNIPEAHAGITCETCHNIVAKPDITGNGKYIIGAVSDYPFSKSTGLLAQVNKMLVRADPRAHKQNMLKPFHSESEFCLTCHKVSLDTPINNYRWLRGQDEYDAWQASGVSYNAVASFYNPPNPLRCQSCHMEKVASNDKGHEQNLVFGHFFPAANTALPTLPLSENNDWLKRTTNFLQNDRIAVDIFGAVVDQKLIAPLGKQLHIKPGQSIRLEVVVRTKKIGHTFPGGTIDSNEPWLEVTGVSSDGTIVMSSGFLQADKHVDPSAHFFRGILLDGHGEFILKRNPHEWRTTLYNNSIPPGSADIIHYSWKVPSSFDGEISLKAKLNYRKFNRSITETFIEDEVDLPIVLMAADSLLLTSADSDLATNDSDYLRWNDYGIGMLRQKNLATARTAFEMVVSLNPEYADGFVNIARVLIKEGKFDNAKDNLNRALELKNAFPKAYYFLALIAKMEGKNDHAIELFQLVRKTHPDDRVMLKNFGQTYFFAENWAGAKSLYHDVLRIDPEDADAHYNLMLINRKLGNLETSKIHSEKYLKYKPDEQARSISQITRLKFPHANNEAQPVHSHELIDVEKFRDSDWHRF